MPQHFRGLPVTRTSQSYHVISGVVPPLATPLKEIGRIWDLDSLTRLIAFYMIDAGVHGLFLLGTSGEAVFHDSACGTPRPGARRKDLSMAACLSLLA